MKVELAFINKNIIEIESLTHQINVYILACYNQIIFTKFTDRFYTFIEVHITLYNYKLQIYMINNILTKS